MTPEFWAGPTRARHRPHGFKGAWLCLWLEMLGAETHGYALPPPTMPSLYERANVNEAVRSTLADVRDLAPLSASSRSSARGGLPHGGAVARPTVLRRPGRDVLDQRPRDRPCPRGDTPSGRPMRRRQRDDGQGYENVHKEGGYREDDAVGGHDRTRAARRLRSSWRGRTAASFFSPERRNRRASRWRTRAPEM